MGIVWHKATQYTLELMNRFEGMQKTYYELAPVTAKSCKLNSALSATALHGVTNDKQGAIAR